MSGLSALNDVERIERELEALAARAAQYLRRPPRPGQQAALASALLAMVPVQDRLRPALRDARRSPALADGTRAGEARLRLWPEVRRLVLALADPERQPPQPLLPDPAPGTTAASQSRLAGALYARLHDHLGGQHHGAEPGTYHPDIPLPLAGLTALFLAARRLCLARRRSSGLSFLDVGCGLGATLLLAAQVFDRVTGLEYFRPTFDRARSLTAEEPRIGLIPADALHWQGYGGFDVIYWFQPIREEGLARQLDARILAQARPGTVLIAPGALAVAEAGAPLAAQVVPDIYLAGTTAEEAEALRFGAEWIGPDLPGGDPVPLGWMKPLVDACRALGYDLPPRGALAV